MVHCEPMVVVTLVINLVGQFRHDTIGCGDLKQRMVSFYEF